MGLWPLLGLVGSHADDVSSEYELRVPGMTKSFTIAFCPGSTIDNGEDSVEIPALYVLTTELTWDLYDIYVYKLDEPGSDADAISRPSKPYVPPDRGYGHEGYPAIGMTRQAAEGFCQWLSERTGLAIRLPTSTEWAYLASGGRDSPYCCGIDDDSLGRVAWFNENAEHTTHPVGEKVANGFGLFDMHGNATEWVMTDTRKPIAMGGSFREPAEECTAQSSQKQVSNWNQSDPQFPKSQWWLADCSWVGFRFVIEAHQINPEALEELKHVTE